MRGHRPIPESHGKTGYGLPGTVRFSTNSAPRWQRARAWVERALPDAVLDDLQRHDASSLEQLMAAGPAGTEPEEAPPEPAPELSAEDMEALRKMLHQRQLHWIDENIPMLGGRTPREAVRTQAGRRQVQQLLRTFTPVMGPAGIAFEPPVAEIRQRLGLPAEDDEDVEPASPIPPRHADGPAPRGTMFDDRNARKRARRKQKKGRKGKKTRASENIASGLSVTVTYGNGFRRTNPSGVRPSCPASTNSLSMCSTSSAVHPSLLTKSQ